MEEKVLGITNEIKKGIYELEKEDRTILLLIRQDLYNAKDWKTLKEVNRILLEMNYLEKQKKLDAFPTDLQIEHTSFCNARCIMCSHAFTSNHGAVHMSDDTLERIETLLPFCAHVTMHGVGEPFLHPGIIPVLQRYSEYGIRLSGNTNGSYMTEELANTVNSVFDNLSVSCDAANARTYEIIRRGLRFETFLRNVRLLRSEAANVHLRMAVVAMRQNLQEMPDIVRLAASLGFDDVFISDVTTSAFLQNERDSIVFFPEEAKYYLSEALRAGKAAGIRVKVPENLSGPTETDTNLRGKDGKGQMSFNLRNSFRENSFYDELEKRYKKFAHLSPFIDATQENLLQPSEYKCEGICEHLLKRPFIDSGGNLFLCCINWLHRLGNIHETDFETIWNGELMQSFRQMFYEGVVPKYCVGCIFLRNKGMSERCRVLNIDSGFHRNSFDETAMQIFGTG